MPPMNRPLILTMALGCLTGCGGDAPPPNTAGGANSPAVASVRTPTAGSANTVGVKGQTVQSAPIPAGARFTIFVARYAGPGHEQTARLAKDRLMQTIARRDIHIIHKT